MPYHANPTLQHSVGADKDTPAKRSKRGLMITTAASKSVVCQNHADAKAAADEVAKETVTLDAAVEAYDLAEAAYKKARTALATAVVAWDGSFDVYVALGDKYCATADDGVGMGMGVRGKTINPLVMPLAVEPKYNGNLRVIRVHINRAPGMRTVDLERSTTPDDPASWARLEGNGAQHVIPSPAPGTHWFRAASRTAKGKSDFTTPVSVIVL